MSEPDPGIPQFDPFELEKIQVELVVIGEANKLLQAGKNLSQVAKILQEKGHRVSYGQLQQLVKKGTLPDKFKHAKELAKELCEQGLDIDAIVDELKAKGFAYTHQWVGRWISENEWVCKTKEAVPPPEIPAPTPPVIEVAPEPLPLPPVEPLPPLVEPPPTPVDPWLVIALLQKISGKIIVGGDSVPDSLPEEWVKPLSQTSFSSPMNLVSNILRIDAESVTTNFLEYLRKEKNKTKLTLKLLTKIIGLEIRDPTFAQKVEAPIVGSLTPLQLVSNITQIKPEQIINLLSDVKNLLAAEEIEKSRNEEVTAMKETFKRAVETLTVKKVEIAEPDTIMSHDELTRIPLTQMDWRRVDKFALRDIITSALGTFKILTMADFISLVGKTWPNLETLDAIEKQWGKMEVYKLGYTIGRFAIPTMLGINMKPHMETLNLILNDLTVKRRPFFVPREIVAWLALFVSLASLLKESQRQEKEDKTDGYLEVDALIDVIPVKTLNPDQFIAHFVSLGLLTQKTSREFPAGVEIEKVLNMRMDTYKPNEAAIVSLINNLYAYLRSNKVWEEHMGFVALSNAEKATLASKSISEYSKKAPAPNQVCFCGSEKKFKKCHGKWFD